MRTCIACREVKEETDFYRYAYTTNQGKPSHRLESKCKVCKNTARKTRRRVTRQHNIEMCRRWRTEKPEQMREAILSWRKNNPERAAQSLKSYRARNVEKVRLGRIISEQRRRLQGFSKNVEYVRVLTKAVLELARVGDKYLDAYSGELIDHPTIDHIIPLSRGGDHSYENLCVTSKSNNSSKHATPLLLWLVRKAAA